MVILIFTGNKVKTGAILNEKELSLENGEKLWLFGEVEKKEPKTEGIGITLKGAYPEDAPQEQYRIQVYISKETSCQIGDKIRVYGKIKRLQVSRNKGMFNQALYYKAQNIQYTCTGEEIQIVEAGKRNWREEIYRIRMKLYTRLQEVYPADTAELLAAILLGIKSGLEEETKSLYQKAGILHLISISGLHISCIGLGLYHFLRKMGAGFGASGVVTTLFLVFYGILSGESVSAQRAIIMAFFMMGAWYLGRSYDLITALSYAALFILLESPYQLYQAGFQLSFGAVLGIGVVAPELERAFARNNKVIQAVVTNLGIQLTTLPIILYYYYEIPLYSLLLNLILVPCMSIVLCSGLLGVACSFVGTGFGRFWGSGAVFLLIAYEKTADVTLHLPFSNIHWGQPTLTGICVYYLLLVCVVFLFHKMNERKDKIFQEESHLYGEFGWEDKVNLCGLGVMLLSCLLLKYQPQEPLKITMLDVGQGDGIVIEERNAGVYLVDGGSSDVKQVGKYRILPFLKAEGISKIQGIFISHMDSDHISGIKELLESHSQGEMQIERVYLPDVGGKDETYLEMEELIKEQNIEIVYLSRGMHLKRQGLELELLQPVSKNTYQDKNEYSMVFRLAYQDFSMLFTGDVEGQGEEELLQSGKLEKTTILKAAHHGSEYTMSEETLAKIQPEITWISCGTDNSYGHPHQGFLERINKLNSKMYVTMNDGAITVETDGIHMIIYEKCKQ
jgi:competence protein ComEC